jgi:hypothetical protein
MSVILWFISFLIIGSIPFSCKVDRKEAYSVLGNRRCDHVLIGDYDWFGCGPGFDYSVKFTCIKNERRAKGIICADVTKKYTIKWEDK